MSYADAIQNELGFASQFEKGRRGQFEVLVDGRTVIARSGGLLAKLLKKPWPADDEVVAAVKNA